MIRFVHTADVQLGTPFARLPEPSRSRVRDRRFDTFEKVLKLASERETDFVVVAGDLFDSNTVERNVVARACSIIAAAGVPVYVLPGNHDHGGHDSVYRRSYFQNHAPNNLCVLLDQNPIVVAGGRAILLPAPLTTRNAFTDTTQHLDAELGHDNAPDAIRIGVAHGATEDFGDAAQATNPIDPAVVDRAHLDYLALGDWHGRKQVARRVWYSGTPEPDRFKENEPGHVLIVDIAQPGASPKVDTERVAHFTWLRHDAQLRGEHDIDTLESWLDEIDRPDRTLVRLELQGSIDAAQDARLRSLLDHARASLVDLRERGAGVKVTLSEQTLALLPLEGFVKATIDALRARAATKETHPEDAAVASQALQLFYRLYTENRETPQQDHR
jgi:DNA repair exonuclease SbcCD nuclease subunit